MTNYSIFSVTDLIIFYNINDLSTISNNRRVKKILFAVIPRIVINAYKDRYKK